MLRPALCLWPMRRIGSVSYGIYLYHMLIRHFVDKGTYRFGWTSRVTFFVATTLLTWAVAEVSYRFYESRFLARKAQHAA